MNLTLRNLCDAGKVQQGNCDQIKTQFRRFRESVLQGNNSSAFRDFNPSEDRVDELLYGHLSARKEYTLLLQVMKKVLILSHGQAPVERGFSINESTVLQLASNSGLTNLASKSFTRQPSSETKNGIMGRSVWNHFKKGCTSCAML